MTYPKCFSFHYILEQLRRFWWISALYFIFLFFLLPFRLLVGIENIQTSIARAAELAATLNAPITNFYQFDFFNFFGGLECLAFIIGPVFLAALLFSYMNKRKNLDTIHALPITRVKLFWLNVASGATLYILPLLITALILCVIISAVGFWSVITFSSMMIWLGNSLLFLTLFFSIAVFFAICSGNVAVMIIMTYIFLFLPQILYMIINGTMSLWLYGYALTDFSILTKLTPIINIFTMLRSGVYSVGALEGVITLAVAIIFLLLGCVLYRRRKSEAAGETLVFKPSRPIVKYVIAICASALLGFVLFYSVDQSSVGYTILGYLIGGVLGYIIVHAIIHKNVRSIKRDFKGLALYLVVILVVTSALCFDFFGYQKRVPEADKIKQVYFDPFFYQTNNGESPFTAVYRTPENIELLRQMHIDTLSEKFDSTYSIFDNRTTHYNAKSDLDFNTTLTSPFELQYDLSNGGKVTREYNYNFDTFKKYMSQIFSTYEGKRNAFLIFNKAFLTPEEIQITDARDAGYVNRNPEQIKNILNALKADIEVDPSPVDFDLTSPMVGNIRFTSAENQNAHQAYQYWIKPTYQNTITALNSYGIAMTPLRAQDVKSLTIEGIHRQVTNEYGTQTVTESITPLEVTDPVRIQQTFDSLKQASAYFGYKDDMFNVTITLTNGTTLKIEYAIDPQNIPQFVSDSLIPAQQ